MPGSKRSASAAAADPPAQRSRGEELPLNFNISGGDGDVDVRVLPDDPWHVSRKGVIIKPYGSWWGYTGAEGTARYPCEIVGYVESFKYVDGKTDKAYILAEEWLGDTSYYAMEPKNVWALLLVKDRPAREVASDDEDVDRDGVDDEDHPGGGEARRGRRPAAADRPPNAPRLADEWAEEINGVINELHGSKEEVDEVVDEETGEVKGKAGSQRVPTGWEDETCSEPPQACSAPADLKLKKPIPRHYCPRGQQCTWRLIDSFRWCWPVIGMVTVGTNEYYDYHAEMHDEECEGAKKLTNSHAKWPERWLNEATGKMEGGITEAHYEGYLAIIFFMGVVRCRDMEWHWSVPRPSSGTPDFHHNFVRRIMTKKFFHLFRRFLHYSDARAKVPRGDWKPAASGAKWIPPPDGYDMIHNFRPIMDACNVAWCALVTLVAALTYDEQMVKCAMHTKLSRRQPNKPIRDGFQIFALCAASGAWYYCCWIDQGKNDPALFPPYVYGWHAAILLHLVALAGVAGTWCTIAFDQAFPTPALFLALARLGVYAVGTCQQNRRGFPSLQIAQIHKDREGGFKAVKVVGQAVHLCHGVCIAGTWVFLLAVQWFDKNVVTMLSNKHGDDMKPYEYKAKGEVDPLQSEQPETREEYNDTNNGVDLKDQGNAATINPHGSKITIWHRMHDHYANQASHLACTHFRLVIEAHGTQEQKEQVNGKFQDDGTRKGGMRTDDLRWKLMVQLAEKTQFGCEGDPHICNLRCGSKGRARAAANAAGADADADADAAASPFASPGAGRRTAPRTDSPATDAAPKVQRRQGDAHEIAFTACKGVCSVCGSRQAQAGCKTCGVRFCGGTRSYPPFHCMNAHFRGDPVQHPSTKKVVWWAPEA